MFCISVIEETVFGTSGLLLNRQKLINCFHLGCSVPVAHICMSVTLYRRSGAAWPRLQTGS